MSQSTVFKNFKRSQDTPNLLPYKIFIAYFLKPMRPNWEDETKLTPISVIFLNRQKANIESHLLLCTFSSLDGVSLLKQNAYKLSRQVTFNPRVPSKYSIQFLWKAHGKRQSRFSIYCKKTRI